MLKIMKNIHILSANKPSRLGFIYESNQYHIINGKDDFLDNLSIDKNIYITSDEEIKEGDVVKIPCGVGKVKELFWKWGNDNPSYIVEDIFIYKLRYGQKEGELQINSFRYEDVKKIILTTDQDLINDGVQKIDNDFLEWLVKNPSCEWVEISLEETQYGSGIYEYVIYKREIPKEEPKPFKQMKKLTEVDWKKFKKSPFSLKEEPKKIFDLPITTNLGSALTETMKSISQHEGGIKQGEINLPNFKEEVIKTEEDAKIFVETMENIPEPNDKLKKSI